MQTFSLYSGLSKLDNLAHSVGSFGHVALPNKNRLWRWRPKDLKRQEKVSYIQKKEVENITLDWTEQCQATENNPEAQYETSWLLCSQCFNWANKIQFSTLYKLKYADPISLKFKLNFASFLIWYELSFFVSKIRNQVIGNKTAKPSHCRHAIKLKFANVECSQKPHKTLTQKFSIYFVDW